MDSNGRSIGNAREQSRTGLLANGIQVYTGFNGKRRLNRRKHKDRQNYDGEGPKPVLSKTY
jgi:hypothetical protein